MSKHRNKHQHNNETAHNHQNPPNPDDAKWASAYTPHVEPSAEDEERYANEQRGRDSQRRIGIWLNVITAVGTCVALVGLCYLWGSLRAAKTAADVAKQTMHVGQRPWLGIDGLPELDKTDKGSWFVVVGIKNYGLSPGLHSILNSQSAATFYGDLPAMEMLGCQMADALTAGKLGARSGDAAQNGYTIFPNQPPLKFKVGIEKSDKNAIVWGCITYMDEFSKLEEKQPIIHHTPFCYLAKVPFQVGEKTDECFAVAPAD